jgi:hypothetical protein
MSIKDGTLLRGVEIMGMETPILPLLDAHLHLDRGISSARAEKKQTITHDCEHEGNSSQWHRTKASVVGNSKRVVTPEEGFTDCSNECHTLILINVGLEILLRLLAKCKNRIADIPGSGMYSGEAWHIVADFAPSLSRHWQDGGTLIYNVRHVESAL